MFLEGSKPTTQDVVLRAVGKRLMSQLPSVFNPANVMYSLDEDSPDILRQYTVLATVMPMDGSFDEQALDGGAQHTCIEQTGVILSFYSRQSADKKGSAEVALFGYVNNRTLSMLRIKRECLRLFTGHMLTDPQDGQPILTEVMTPVRAATPNLASDERMGQFADMSLSFTCPFLWDLSEASE